MKCFFRFVYPIVLTVVACWLTFDLHGRPTRGVDDAQILFSYSSNLAAGRGFVYANNPQHVEGATSFLWTLICAVPFRLGFDESGVLVISIILLCFTQILVIDMIRRSAAAQQVQSWPFELAYLLAVFSSPTYLTWMSITLMDTCLWGLLVVLMTYVAVSPPYSRLGAVVASVPFFLAPLSRPEAVVVAPAIIGLAWLRGADHREGRRRLSVSLAAAFLVSAVAVTVFRLSYFGYPLPNTFYAKVSPSLAYNLTAGAWYLAGYVLNSGSIVVAAALFLLWCAGDSAVRVATGLRHGARLTNRDGVATWRVTALAAMVLLVIPVLTGGDHFVGYRFYQPAFPVMLLAAVLFLIARLPLGGIECLAPRRRPKPGLAAAVLLMGLVYWAYSGANDPSWLQADLDPQKVIKDQFTAADGGIKDGSRLRALFSGSERFPAVGVTAAGGIARTYPGRIVDLMGLNTPVIAHRPGARRGFKNHAAFEKDAFFEIGDIDVLVASPPVPPATSSGVSRALKGLLDDTRFVSDWRYGVLYLTKDDVSDFEAFYPVRFIDSLEGTGRYRFRETMRWSGKRWVVADGTDSVQVGRGTDSGPDMVGS